MFEILNANVAMNCLINAFLHFAALGEQSGQVFVPQLDITHTHNFGGVSVENHKQGQRVAMRTLDSYKLGRCDFIKIDVEGMELSVLKGTEATIKKFQPVMYVENDRPEKSGDLISYIAGLGYKMYWHKPRLYSKDNFFHNEDNVFANTVSINMLCIPPNRALTDYTEITLPEVEKM